MRRPPSTFHQDKIKGVAGEQLATNTLSKAFTVRATDGRSHDLEVEIDGLWLSCEVKADYMSAFTKNLAIEWRNDRTGQASGLLSSRATLWVVVTSGQVWAANTLRMKQLFHSGGHIRDVPAAGDGNARVRLFKCADLLGPHMVRLDNLEKEALYQATKSLLLEGVLAGQPAPLVSFR